MHMYWTNAYYENALRTEYVSVLEAEWVLFLESEKIPNGNLLWLCMLGLLHSVLSAGVKTRQTCRSMAAKRFPGLIVIVAVKFHLERGPSVYTTTHIISRYPIGKYLPVATIFHLSEFSGIRRVWW